MSTLLVELVYNAPMLLTPIQTTQTSHYIPTLFTQSTSGTENNMGGKHLPKANRNNSIYPNPIHDCSFPLINSTLVEELHSIITLKDQPCKLKVTMERCLS